MKFGMNCAVCIGAIVSSLAAIAPAAAQTQDQAGPAVSKESGDIVVTARRREERLQDVPVAVTAIGGASLAKANIVQVQELQQKVPGLTIQASSFGSNVLQVAIRGQRQFDPYLTKDQAVAVYFADVVQSRPQGLNSALFDLQSAQVLKGPQGTLFGRNTTGGALLLVPKAPSDYFEGYVSGGIGNFESRRLEGAVNVPLGEWAAIRVGGSLQRRKGFTQNITTGQRLDDEHRDSWRVSLRLSPSDSFENRTVVSGSKSDENGIGYKLTALIPGSGFGSDPSLTAELARLRGLPFWTTTSNLVLKTDIKTFGISNVTELKLSPEVTIKNIFGYRYVSSHIPFDFAGSAATFADGTGTRYNFAPSREDMEVKQYSNELQMLGTLFDGSLDYILGGFYFLERGSDRQQSGGKFGVTATVNSVAGVYVGDRATFANPIRNQSYSGFAQFTWRVPFLQGVSLTAGGRQTHDRRELTYRPLIAGGINNGVCRFDTTFSAADRAACSYSTGASFNRFTYTFSADWKITPDIMVYIAHRKGYRAGGFNISAVSLAGVAPFQPEDVKDIEVGLKTKFRVGGGNGTLNIAAYTQDYKNIQRGTGGTVVVNGVSQFVQSIFNVASARVKGFEVELDLHPAEWLDAGVNVSNIDARYNDWFDRNAAGAITADNRPSVFAGTPSWSVSSYVGLNIPVGSTELGVRADYYTQTKTQMVDKNYYAPLNMLSPTGNLPGYGIVNGRVELRHIAGVPLTVSVWAKNLLNEKYYAGGTDLANSGLGWGSSFMGPPRTFGVEARYDF